jgi:hypothetical protein
MQSTQDRTAPNASRCLGNPTLDTLGKATGVLGYKLTLVPKERIVGSSASGHVSGQRATAAKAKRRA